MRKALLLFVLSFTISFIQAQTDSSKINLEKGKFNYNNKNYTEARSYVDKAIKADSSNGEAY
jgi:hypothetical protein